MNETVYFFIATATIVSFAASLIWKHSDTLNFVIKVGLFLLGGWGFFILLKF